MNLIPKAARASIKLAPETWTKWLAICDAIQRDEVEVDLDEFAPFSEKFNTLLSLGVPFDDGFILRVRELQRSLVNTSADEDEDGADLMLSERELNCDEHGEITDCDEHGERDEGNITDVEHYTMTAADRPPFKGKRGSERVGGMSWGNILRKYTRHSGDVIYEAVCMARRQKFPLLRGSDLAPTVECWRRSVDRAMERRRDDGL